MPVSPATVLIMIYDRYITRGESYNSVRRRLEAFWPRTHRRTLRYFTEEIIFRHGPPDLSITITALRFLLNRHIRSFHLGFYLLAFLLEPDVGDQVLQVVVSKATHLRELTIRFEMSSFEHDAPLLKESMLTKIMMLITLRRMHIEMYHLTLEQVATLCGKLIMLTCLSVKIFPREHLFSENTISQNEFVLKLRQLKKFYFSSRWEESEIGNEFQRKLTLFCLRSMKNLMWVGQPEFFVDMTKVFFGVPGFPITHVGGFLTEYMSIETNILTNGAAGPHTFRFFPNVKELLVKIGKEDQGAAKHVLEMALRHFINLHTLTIDDIKSSDNILQILANYERNLQCVHLNYDKFADDDAVNFSFQLLFEKGNNFWEKLVLRNIRNYSGEAEFSLANMMALQVLEITFVAGRVRNPVSLYRILSAPNLKSVTLCNMYVTSGDVIYTSQKIKDRLILTNIDEITLEVCVNEDNTFYFHEIEEVQQLGQELRERLLEYRINAEIDFEVLVPHQN